MVRSDQADELIERLEELFAKGKTYGGLAFTVPMTSVIGTLSYGFLSNDTRTVKKD